MTGLEGKRVLVTRPRQQAGSLVDKLSAMGAIPILFPAIEIRTAVENPALDRAINELETYKWIIFTSVNGVQAFWQRVEELRPGKAVFQDNKVAAIGPKTARALQERGVRVDFVPGEYRAEAILNGLGDVRGLKILLARTDLARKNLLDLLIGTGALAEEISVYQVVPAQVDPLTMVELSQGIDIATFTSSSTVRNFLALSGGIGRKAHGYIINDREKMARFPSAWMVMGTIRLPPIS